MSEKAGALLKNARKSAGMTRQQGYQVTAISESVLDRWERGETVPDLESLDKLELLYHAPGLWEEFLRATSPAYAAHHPVAAVDRSLLAQVVSVGHEADDVQALQDRVERDLVDGRIDRPQEWHEYLRQMRELNAATGAVLLKSEMEGVI